MAIRLTRFSYVPSDVDGWTSGQRSFGKTLTAIVGPNGSGKTPIMKGIMLALGHTVELPPPIPDRCATAEVTLVVDDNRKIVLRRHLRSDFSLTVIDGEGLSHFTSELDFSRWLMQLLGGDERTLTNKRSESTELYASVLYPAFWVDQDQGWTTAYWTPAHRDFIRNQRQEVMRFLLGLPPRHPFRARDDYDQAVKDLARADKDVELQRYVMQRLVAAEDSLGQEEVLSKRRDELQRDIKANSEVLEAISATTAVFDREIAAIEQERSGVQAELAGEAQSRKQLQLVLAEIDGEAEVLTANVQATDLFRQFCAREDCQMFLSSEQSYGRALLFLKDQIKDLKESDAAVARRVTFLEKRSSQLESQVLARRNERAKAVAASPDAQALEKIERLTQDLVQVELLLSRIHQYRAEQRKFEEVLNRRERVAATVAELKPRGGRTQTDAVLDARARLTQSMAEWLQVLNAQNLAAVGFDDEFGPTIGGVPFTSTSAESGSTRTRIVLAFHAALLEVALDRGGPHPGWLLCDAPRQQELAAADFEAYIAHFDRLKQRHGEKLQVVFSTETLTLPLNAPDCVWLPEVTATDDPTARFLGNASAEDKGHTA